MKIAGRKNDGAWFRTNKMIKNMSTAERANLAGSIAVSPYIDAAYNALTAMMAETGVTIPIPATVAAWCAKFMDEGIPRQIWNGHLSWTTYTKGGDGKYRPNYQGVMLTFAADLRRLCIRYAMTRRQVRDLFDLGSRLEGNPSGMPDAIRDSHSDVTPGLS